MNTIRIILADDHSILVESLALLVGLMEGVEVAGIAANGVEALELLEKQGAEVVLSDLHMPGMGGIDLAMQIGKRFPEVKVLLLTMDEEPDAIKEAMKAGAKGYVLKNATRDELETAIRTVKAGGKYYNEHIMARLARGNGSGSGEPAEPTDPADSLTSREIEIIRYIINEVPTSQIAEELFIAPTTVETHRRNIFKKLGIHSVVGLTRYAYNHGLL